MMQVAIFDLEKGEYFQEDVYGKYFLHWLYNSKSGQRLQFIFTGKLFNQLYGLYHDTIFSHKKIADFIRQYRIKTYEFEQCEYKTFNQYFSRKFIGNVRNFGKNENEFCAFAEGRYKIYPKLSSKTTFEVKGLKINLEELLRDKKLAQQFHSGCLMIARLAPVDYHRFHFPCNGKVLEQYNIAGSLHSVGGWALRKKNDILFKNKRSISLLECGKFGKIAYVEVGALAAGKICQTHKEAKFHKGLEKGYFEFGGSTVIVLVGPNKIRINPTIIEQTQKGYETFIKLGYPIGTCTHD